VHCFPGLNEMRAHASSGNMRPPVCMTSADGAHNSCPQVLHSQVRTLLPCRAPSRLRSPVHMQAVAECLVAAGSRAQRTSAFRMIAPACCVTNLKVCCMLPAAAICAGRRAGARCWRAQWAATRRAPQPVTFGGPAAKEAATRQHAEPPGASGRGSLHKGNGEPASRSSSGCLATSPAWRSSGSSRCATHGYR
jgi:hypothetical protein